MCVIGWVASRACYIGVIGLSEGGPATRDLPGTNMKIISGDDNNDNATKPIPNF